MLVIRRSWYMTPANQTEIVMSVSNRAFRYSSSFFMRAASWSFLMAPKLRNRPLSLEESQASVAKRAVKAALQDWYKRGYEKAEKKLPELQKRSNLETVASIPGWHEKKGPKNGFVMLVTLQNGIESPFILKLDNAHDDHDDQGRLTYRQLYQQIREGLELEKKVSLRLCPFRPWYRHITKSFPLHDHVVIPVHDAQCTHLLGTTLVYYTYVHRSSTEDT